MQSMLTWLGNNGLAAPSRIIHCDSPTLMGELMRRTDIIGYCPVILLNDSMFSVGMEPFDVTPLPPPMTMGLISLRGAPLHSSAKSLAALFAQHLRQVP